jgi:hypothetical protein
MKDLTLNEYRTIKLIVELYKANLSPATFWRLSKIVLEIFNEETA